MASAFRLADLLSGNRSKTIPELLEWQNKVFRDVISAYPHMENRIKFSGSVPVGMLPYSKQVAAIRDYRDITGLDTVFDILGGTKGVRQEQLASIFSKTILGKPEGADSQFIRLPLQGDDELTKYYKGLNLQYSDRVRDLQAGIDRGVSSDRVGSHFTVGVQSYPRFDGNRFNMPTKMAPGSTYTAFDLETASLRMNGVRELSYSTGTVGAAGQFENTVRHQELFRPKSFARGSMALEGGALPIEQFMHDKHGLNIMGQATNNLGADYVKKMTPFLESMKSSDYIIGHNILSFDIPQVFSSLAGTKAYGSDVGFRELVDSTHSHVMKNAIDTLVLARESPNIAGLMPAKELLARGDASSYSIENLLLQTNLGERMGLDKLKALMGDKGLHFGEVDDAITMELYKHLGNLKPKTLGGSPLARNIRNQVIGSAAVTPYTDIRKASEIADPVMKKLIDVKGAIYVPKGQKELADLLGKAQGGDAQAAQLAFEKIRSGTVGGLRFNLNPIEHEILSQRRLGMGTNLSVNLNPENVMFKNNIFERAVVGNFDPQRNFSLGINGYRRVSPSGFASMQEELSRAGMPFAGLSLEERSFGTAIHHITGDIRGGLSASIKALTGDTMVGQFEQFDPNVIQYATASGRPTLPASLLRSAGLLEDNSGDLLRLSAVEGTAFSPESSLNLVYDFNEEGKSKFVNYVSELLGRGDNEEIANALGVDMTSLKASAVGGDRPWMGAVERFKNAVNNDDLIGRISQDASSGVTIGQLQGEYADDVIGLLKNTSAMDRLSDTKGIDMRVPFKDLNGGIIRTAGAISTTHLDEASRAFIPGEVRRAGEVYEAFGELGQSKNLLKLQIAKKEAQFGGEALSPLLKDIYEGWQRTRGHIPKAASGAALVGLATHFYNKHQENKQFNATLEQQPYETGNSGYGVAQQLQMRKDSGIDRSYQRYDPLATAYVVDNLNDNKINHSLMGNGKNSTLYGGIL